MNVDERPFGQLWSALDSLERGARDLRRLSQEEPLLKARPDYPSARVGKSHANELREVFADLANAFADSVRLLPSALANGAAPGLSNDETPAALAGRLEQLQNLTAGLAREAFEPLPPLPPHAPPYLVTIPGNELPGTKALLLGNSIAALVASLRNALLAAANAARADRGPDPQ